MFDGEITSVIAIFAGIAALIAYISERAKRKLNTRGQALKLKKMPGAVMLDTQGSNLEEWNFPQAIHDTSPTPTSESTTASEFGPSALHLKPALTGPTYQEIAPPSKHAIERTSRRMTTHHSKLGTRSQLRDSIVTMTVLGPCRALAPFQDRE